MNDERVRILLADRQSLFREAVGAVLASEPDLEVVAVATDGAEAVDEAERTRPDIALIDATLPVRDGVEATSMIKERVPGCRVLVLAGDHDQNLLVEALGAGASGYLSKESPLSELIQATRQVHAGETLVPRQMLGALIDRLITRRREQDEAIRRMSSLTRREREVLAQLAGGADNEAIAFALVISPETARTHVQNVLGKLGVHSRLEAQAFVHRHGIFEELGAER
ncbi:MAG: response regulator [Actinomycetota bacterium]